MIFYLNLLGLDRLGNLEFFGFWKGKSFYNCVLGIMLVGFGAVF